MATITFDFSYPDSEQARFLAAVAAYAGDDDPIDWLKKQMIERISNIVQNFEESAALAVARDAVTSLVDKMAVDARTG